MAMDLSASSIFSGLGPVRQQKLICTPAIFFLVLYFLLKLVIFQQYKNQIFSVTCQQYKYIEYIGSNIEE
jgi:hypothetical protein